MVFEIFKAKLKPQAMHVDKCQTI
uniref:Uncharacterized protein n=1 Tax=Rhizophora mucronata TaxID=61149 RepID=A0A2P2NX04_RHIMU